MTSPTSRHLRIAAPIIGAALLLMYSSTASAQVEASSAFIEVANSIENKLKEFVASADMIALGWQLFGFFVAANLVYSLLKNMALGTGLNGIIGDVVPLTISGAVVVAFLSYGLAGAISDTMNVLTTAVAGEQNGTLSSLMISAAGTAGQTIRNLWILSPTTGTSSPGGLAAISELLLGIPAVIMNVIATVVGIFFVLMTLAIYLAHLVMSQVSVYIALMLAPFFVPFLMFPPASFLFEGWLRFFLIAALLKTVGLILLKVTEVIMAAVLQISQSPMVEGTNGADAMVFDITKYSMIILLSGIGVLLMGSATSIASGLVSGGGGASFGGWSSLASRALGTKAIMGGMKLGGSGPSAKGGHALTGLASATPSAAKPVVNAAGKVLSRAAGGLTAMADRGSARQAGASNGERSVGRDTSGMSSATAGAYMKSMERANSRMAKAESSAGFYGPPSPRYTVNKPASSTTPRSTQGRR